MFVGFRRRCDYPDPVFRSVFAHRSPCSGTDRKGWLRKGDVSSCAPRTCAPFSVSPPPVKIHSGSKIRHGHQRYRPSVSFIARISSPMPCGSNGVWLWGGVQSLPEELWLACGACHHQHSAGGGSAPHANHNSSGSDETPPHNRKPLELQDRALAIGMVEGTSRRMLWCPGRIFGIHTPFRGMDTEDTSKIPQDTIWRIFDHTNR